MLNDIIRKLRNDPLYKRALAMAQSDEERRTIAAQTEAMVLHVARSLVPAITAVNNDPTLAAKVRQAATSSVEVVSAGAPTNVSGSVR